MIPDVGLWSREAGKLIVSHGSLSLASVCNPRLDASLGRIYMEWASGHGKKWPETMATVK